MRAVGDDRRPVRSRRCVDAARKRRAICGAHNALHGSWDWIGEYADQVMEILATLNTPECMASESEIRAIGARHSDRPEYNYLTPVLKSNGTWAIRYYDADRNLISELITDIWGNPL